MWAASPAASHSATHAAHSAAVRGATTRGATAEDGLASVRAMVALTKSVTTGDWVKLDDVTGGLV